MSTDMCVPCADGVVNIRVGALIAKNGSSNAQDVRHNAMTTTTSADQRILACNA